MRRLMKLAGLCLIFAAVVWMGSIVADRTALRQELIRFHVVAASDTEEDQSVKLSVRDAVIDSLQQEMENLTDVEAAKAYLRENLPKIEAVANRTLKALGVADTATVKLCTEKFATRVYDTFSLPAGVYDTLRITIGAGEGRNWWCVVFPSLCLPATSEGFEAVAVGSGFSETLTQSLTGEGYELRFFLLDVLGRLENFLYR